MQVLARAPAVQAAGWAAQRRRARVFPGAGWSSTRSSRPGDVTVAAQAKERAPASPAKPDEPIDGEWAQEVLKEMVDSPELGQRGEAWFAAQAAAVLLVAFPPGFLRPLLEVSGWLALAGGFGLMIGGQQVLGRRLTPLPKPREGSTLVTTGVYSYCRHPMYGGLVLAGSGLALASGDELRLALAALLFFVLDRKASYGETLLEERFGGEYDRYRQTTKKLLPYIY